MSPLNVEVYNPEKEEWIKAAEVKPGDPPGSISQNKPDGAREVYVFECAPDGDSSTIYRSEAGIDTATPQMRAISTLGLEEVATLRQGESHTVSVKTDVSDTRRVVRFTHNNP